MLFSEWFVQFYNAYCVDVIAYDCYRDYYYINIKHFVPIADKELFDIKPIDIQLCMKTTIAYSSDRQRRTFFLLKRVLREAVVNGYLDKNPVDAVKPPKRIRKNVQCFEPIHIQQLFDSDTALCRMFRLDIWTGLRRGELLALEWKNIDLENRVINVCQTLVRTASGDKIMNTTKGRCDRIIPLHSKAIEILMQIQAQDSTDGFLFKCEDTNQPITLRQYNRLFLRFYYTQKEKYADLPYYSPHKLRHSYATYMLHSGADIETLRALLGHVDIATTQQYVHSNLKQMIEATNKLTFA